MGDIFKLALRLFVFALVAAVALAMTNEVTKGPIEAQKLAAKMDALNTVLPGCEYAQIEYEGLAEGSSLDEIFEGKDASGAVVGYALTAAPQGYGGPIPITVGISTEGHITQTYVGALQETAGLGTKVAEPDFKDQFIAIAADPDTLNDDVDTIGGATVSSSAFVGAVSEILTYSKNTLGIAPAAGDKEAILAAAAAAAGDAEPVVTTNTYDVNGFGAMKVEVAVDDAGKIVSVKVLEHNETPGFGADLIADTAVFDALVGQDIAGAAIDVKAGVTMTSKAINAALKAAGPQVPTDPYTVKGFGKFTMNVAVQDGVIAAINAPVHGETPGFGADILTEDALDYLVGQDIATAQVDMKSGVTMTSNAIADALKQAAAANGIVVESVEPATDATAAATAAAPVAEAAPAAAGNVYDVTGFQPMKVEVAVDEAGKITSVNVVEHNETPGFGADLINAGFDALVGQDIATAQIDVKSGVTLTSNGINDALKAASAAAPAAEAAPVEEAAAEAAGTVYDVTGFQPMKVEVAVDEAGKITSVNVVEHNETPGFGADLINAGFDALVGQDIATAQIDVKSGVTLTSNGINDALKAASAAAPAAEAAPVEEAAAEAAGTVYDVTGFQPMKVEVAVDEAGKITSVNVVEHNETPGFGADLINAGFDALVGQDIATAQIDVKSGVTLTSNGINDALKAAAAAAPVAEAAPVEEAAAEEVVAVNATVYEMQVKGMSKHPFTLNVSVDESGKIVAASSPANSEIEGALADDVLSTLVGQDIADAKLDAKSGATVTGNAVNNALDTIAAHIRKAAAPAEEISAAEEVAAVNATVYEMQVKGMSKHPFTLNVSVDESGKIVAASSPANSEIEGALADDVLSTLVGQDIADAKLDAKSGATVTGNAVNNALDTIAAYIRNAEEVQ